jgi:hypothetical protein
LHRTAAALAVLCFSSLIAGCAAPAFAPGASGTCADRAPRCGSAECVPAFRCDGRLRRDVDTDAPLFLAPSAVTASRAPRFHDDGAVCRDPETGAPLYEEVSGGEVVRVLVSRP